MATPQNPQSSPSSAPKSTPVQPATTQKELANDDGAGIRGGYGDADQTNGLEGGQQSNPVTQPDDQGAE